MISGHQAAMNFQEQLSEFFPMETIMFGESGCSEDKILDLKINK